MQARINDTIEDESGTNVTASVVAKKFSVLDALHMLSCSWLKVTNNTIWNCWRKAKFVSALEEPKVEPEEVIPIPNNISEEIFEEWVAIEKDPCVRSECNFEENEAEIMQQMFSESANGHDEEDYEEEENNKIEATPSSTEMKFILHRLIIGLERRGFEQMDEFKKFGDRMRHFLCYQQPMRQLTLDEFVRKRICFDGNKYCFVLNTVLVINKCCSLAKKDRNFDCIFEVRKVQRNRS